MKTSRNHHAIHRCRLEHYDCEKTWTLRPPDQIKEGTINAKRYLQVLEHLLPSTFFETFKYLMCFYFLLWIKHGCTWFTNHSVYSAFCFHLHFTASQHFHWACIFKPTFNPCLSLCTYLLSCETGGFDRIAVHCQPVRFESENSPSAVQRCTKCRLCWKILHGWNVKMM